MVQFIVTTAILVIIGFLLFIGAAFRKEKDRQNRIFEDELFLNQISLDNHYNENKNKTKETKDDNIRPLKQKNSPSYPASLSQN